MFKSFRFFIVVCVMVFFVMLFSVQAVLANPPTAPTSINVDPGQGRITITWAHSAAAEWYEVYVGTPDFATTLLFQWYPQEQFCGPNTCTFKPNIDLMGGTYAVYIRSYGNGQLSVGGLEGWGGPAQFTLSTQPPPNVVLNVNNVESRNPTFAWQGVERATWYYLWVGTLNPQVNMAYGAWHRADELGCDGMGLCSLTPPNLNLPDGAYTTYMQVWGPGGFSLGNITGVPNWMQGPSFDVGIVAASEEVEVVQLLNAERARLGMGCVVINPLLTQAAYLHSVDMRDNIGSLNHTGSDGSRFWERISRTGYTGQARGENIALGYPSAQSVYQGWFNSPGHYDNMFNSNANEIGVAKVGSYWTMVTASRSNVNTSCN